jgi:para-aminobenzoate synthetase component I
VLEVWDDRVDPFAAVAAYLDEQAFFGADDGRVADVFFAYRISERLRRRPTPSPPEPCPLPLAACRIHDGLAPEQRGGFAVGDWDPSWRPEDYGAAVEAVRSAIGRGDVYQVNLVQHLSAPFEGDAAGLAAALAPLRPLHPAPLTGDGWTIVSGSPELFLARRGDRLVTMPIKGTRPAGAVDLAASAKDAAEHVMIVDLERNDLSRVCVPGTVRWPELMAERELAGVTHLVSTVAGEAQPDATFAEILRATFPGGSITGAPKIAALDQIAALEPVGRGASMGALGRIHPTGDFELALTIRTFAVAEGRIHLWVGGGIVWDSEPEAEIEESWVKARPLLTALAAHGREPALPLRS